MSAYERALAVGGKLTPGAVELPRGFLLYHVNGAQAILAPNYCEPRRWSFVFRDAGGPDTFLLFDTLEQAAEWARLVAEIPLGRH